jgi:hypothetical protein
MTNPQPNQSAHARQFEEMRGVLILKQYHEIGTLTCEYSDCLVFKTLILASATAGLYRKEYCIIVESEEGNGTGGIIWVDFDETKELLLALKYIIETAEFMSAKPTDYTEVKFTTREGFGVGYYQACKPRTEQHAFVKLSSTHSTFLDISQLRDLFALITRGRDYLKSQGAKATTATKIE